MLLILNDNVPKIQHKIKDLKVKKTNSHLQRYDQWHIR